MALEIHDFTLKMKGFVGRIKRGGVLKQLPSGIPFAVSKIRLFFQASCLGNSVCGFLQANSKGVSKIPYCNCSTVECPLNWDPFDGKSVTQSVSDQYKVYLKKNQALFFFFFCSFSSV